ncbi:MAG: hypothetical protein KatS3mg085_065 [Candidatus Dojkabacteria bacterium]|nr:MAG: hypothetical protein KatS3mg085_065 [Candidatus Dojkabacteria bacterium]
MRVFVWYETIEGAWGGINSFLRSLKKELSRTQGIVLEKKITPKTDIVLISAASAGQNKELDVNEIKKNIK